MKKKIATIFIFCSFSTMLFAQKKEIDEFIGRILEQSNATAFNSEKFINNLTEDGLITEEDKRRLLKDFPKGLEYSLQIVPYLKNRLEIDILNYVDKPEDELITDLYERTRQTFFSDLKFEDFKVQKDSTEYKVKKEVFYVYKVAVRYKIGGNNYRDYFPITKYSFDYVREQIQKKVPKDSLFVQPFNVPQTFFNVFLMDVDSDKQIFTYSGDPKKVIVLYLTKQQVKKLPHSINGNANRQELLRTLKNLDSLNLIPKLKREETDEFLIKYRERTFNVDIESIMYVAKTEAMESLSLFLDGNSESKWNKSLERITKKTIIFENYEDNTDEVLKKIEFENQKEDEESRVKEIEYKGSFTFKGNLINFSIKLSKDVKYNLQLMAIVLKVIDKLNIELDNINYPQRYYFYGESILFLNESQKRFLEEKGMDLMD